MPRLSAQAFLRDLETDRFSADINVASGLQQLVRTTIHHPVVSALASALTIHRGLAGAVLERIRVLVERPVDDRYESPYDAALVGMTLALNLARRDLGVAAAAIVRGAAQTWWARQVAQALLGPPERDPLRIAELQRSTVTRVRGATTLAQEVGSRNVEWEVFCTADPTKMFHGERFAEDVSTTAGPASSDEIASTPLEGVAPDLQPATHRDRGGEELVSERSFETPGTP